MRSTGIGYLSECSNWGTMTGSSCNIHSYQYRNGVYWCESGSGEFSNAVNLTMNVSRLTVSPSWLSPGASVTLRCEVHHQSAGWRFYWYKAVPDQSHNSYNYELLPETTNGTAQDFYVIHGQTHTAGYVCRAGGGDPEHYTYYSKLEFVWSGDVHPAASLTVSPDRVQHFPSESVSLKCDRNSAEWRVMWSTETRYLSYLPSCSSWWKTNASACTISIDGYHNGVYWCESGSGEFSNAINITAQHKDIMLVSHAHPVTEGASVTLSCRQRGQTPLSNVSFYHNDKLLQNDHKEELNISAVSKSDEGFYKCEHAGKVSPPSWMSVRVKTDVSRPESSLFLVLLIVGTVGGIIFIIFLFLLCHFRHRGSCSSRSIQSESSSETACHGVSRRETHEHSSPLNVADESSDATYSLIDPNNFGKTRRSHEPDEAVVYSHVKTRAAGKSIPASSDAVVYSEVRSRSALDNDAAM
ncbi:Fc receptor-like protein 5 [Odontesthes bonariensis]|uniref:Fc receptor-like protein 5 n=1 Tax=Odontesthes bonariensis TaxID=219752 RepID=UPI003F58365E